MNRKFLILFALITLILIPTSNALAFGNRKRCVQGYSFYPCEVRATEIPSEPKSVKKAITTTKLDGDEGFVIVRGNDIFYVHRKGGHVLYRLIEERPGIKEWVQYSEPFFDPGEKGSTQPYVPEIPGNPVTPGTPSGGASPGPGQARDQDLNTRETK